MDIEAKDQIAQAKEALAMIRAHLRIWEQDVIAGVMPTTASIHRAQDRTDTLGDYLRDAERRA